MAQNTTTVLMKQPIEAQDVSDDDVLYLVKALGDSLRDRKITVAELKKLIFECSELERLVLRHYSQGGSYTETAIDGEKIAFSAGGDGVRYTGAELSLIRYLLTQSFDGGADQLEITPQGISVKRMNGQTTEAETTIAKDAVTSETGVFKKLEGTTPVDANVKKLIVDSSLEIGGVAGSQRGENLVVNGKSTFKNGVNIGNIITLDATTSTCNLTELGGMAGDVVTVYCDGVTGDVTVDVNGAQPHPRHVSIESYCAMSFMYIKSHELSGGVTIHRWAPMHNVSFTYPT